MIKVHLLPYLFCSYYSLVRYKTLIYKRIVQLK